MSRARSLWLFVSVFLLALGGGSFVGCKKDSSPTGPGGGAGSVVNVTGKVIGVNGQPAAGVPVYVAGKPSVNSDANGAFTIASVTVPYDITVVNGGTKQAYIYRGISRSDPTLVFIAFTAGTANAATISGNIYPTSAYPQPATRRTSLAFISPEVAVNAAPNGTVSPATYTKALAWYGPSSTVGTLHALQWDIDASSLPTTYQRYGSRSGVTVTNGGTFANMNDTMSATPGTVTLSGTVTAAAGYTIASKAILAQFGGTTAFPLASESNAASAFSYKTPDISGLTVVLQATAVKTGFGDAVAFKAGVAPNGTGVSLTVPAAPELSLPVDAATGVKAGAPFSWSPFAGGMQILYFNGPAGQPDIYVMTMAASDSLPNLTSAGLPIPASTTYQWSVVAFGPFASMDAATGPGGFIPAGYITGLVQGSGNLGESVSRTFTTAP